MGFELAHEEAAQLLLDLEAEQPAPPGTGPQTAAESGIPATYEAVSERWTEDGISACTAAR